jgi:small-conductance mechanosensitive channel
MVVDFLSKPVFSSSDSRISVGMLLYLVLGSWLIIFLSKLLSRLVVERLLRRYGTEKGVSHAIGTIFRYIFVFIGLIVVIQSTGIDLSALTVLAGALGVGIGFGLQNVTNNFISGIIILFE